MLNSCRVNYIGVSWAYVTSGALTPSTRFVSGTGAEVNCVTDTLTGLMWIKSPSSNSMNWQSALDSIASANAGAGYCGHHDWYLPTVNDLTSLVNDGFIGGNKYQSEWLASQGFSNVQASYYWSSGTDASNTNNAWDVDFILGVVATYGKTNGHYVWPVRLAQ